MLKSTKLAALVAIGMLLTVTEASGVGRITPYNLRNTNVSTNPSSLQRSGRGCRDVLKLTGTMKACKQCNGLNYKMVKSETSSKRIRVGCNACSGGKVTICPACNGTGKINNKQCNDCGGRKEINLGITRNFAVDPPSRQCLLCGHHPQYTYSESKYIESILEFSNRRFSEQIAGSRSEIQKWIYYFLRPMLCSLQKQKDDFNQKWKRLRPAGFKIQTTRNNKNTVVNIIKEEREKLLEKACAINQHMAIVDYIVSQAAVSFEHKSNQELKEMVCYLLQTMSGSETIPARTPFAGRKPLQDLKRAGYRDIIGNAEFVSESLRINIESIKILADQFKANYKVNKKKAAAFREKIKKEKEQALKQFPDKMRQAEDELKDAIPLNDDPAEIQQQLNDLLNRKKRRRLSEVDRLH